VSRRLTTYREAGKSFHRVLGGPLQELNDYLEELKSKKQWAELEALAKASKISRASLLDTLKWRSKKADLYRTIRCVRRTGPVKFTDGHPEAVAAWAEMYDFLKQAYIGFSYIETTEEIF
jgi:Xaa-Pro aminopeptidase